MIERRRKGRGRMPAFFVLYQIESKATSTRSTRESGGRELPGRVLKAAAKAHYFGEETELMDSVHCLRHKITHGWESSLFGRRQLPHRQNNETYSGLGIVSLITYKVAVC